MAFDAEELRKEIDSGDIPTTGGKADPIGGGMFECEVTEATFGKNKDKTKYTGKMFWKVLECRESTLYPGEEESLKGRIVSQSLNPDHPKYTKQNIAILTKLVGKNAGKAALDKVYSEKPKNEKLLMSMLLDVVDKSIIGEEPYRCLLELKESNNPTYPYIEFKEWKLGVAEEVSTPKPKVEDDGLPY